jgi:hypothetical protein|tara:strand:- start:1196 stop:1606 length:411 start_codon:yes stop_codon:yes gene_type:complete
MSNQTVGLVSNLPVNGNGRKSTDVKFKFNLGIDTPYQYVFTVGAHDTNLEAIRKLMTVTGITNFFAKLGDDYQLVDSDGKGIQIKGNNGDSCGFVNHSNFDKEITLEVHGEDIIEAAKVSILAVRDKLTIASAFTA